MTIEGPIMIVAGLDALLVPDALPSVTVMLCAPFDKLLDGVNVHLPSCPTVVEPATLPSTYTVILSPAVPAPEICGWDVELPPFGTTLPVSSVTRGADGVFGTCPA